MKKIILLFSAIFMVVLVNAQSDKEEVELFQSMFGMEKKAAVADFVKVDEAQKDAFWKLYDEYETARKDFGKQRIELLKQYAENYNKFSNETADKWTADVMKLTAATDKLIVTYYKKVKKVTNPVTALQFYQIENYFLTAIRMTVLDQIPFVEGK
jgi:hypothetical protein